MPANPQRRNPDGADGLPYIQPGPWKSKLTEKDVVGVWLGFGVGAPKQFFIIKKVGNKLRGMVCGTCDNPYTMAALDDFRIEGDTLRFNILHEDWGDGEIPTFDKHVTAHVGWNEMRCTTAADHLPPPPAPAGRRPGILAAGSGSDRGDIRQRLAGMAAEEHVVAPLARRQASTRGDSPRGG